MSKNFFFPGGILYTNNVQNILKLTIDGSESGQFSRDHPCLNRHADQCILTAESPAVRIQCSSGDISPSSFVRNLFQLGRFTYRSYREVMFFFFFSVLKNCCCTLKRKDNF